MYRPLKGIPLGLRASGQSPLLSCYLHVCTHTHTHTVSYTDTPIHTHIHIYNVCVHTHSLSHSLTHTHTHKHQAPHAEKSHGEPHLHCTLFYTPCTLIYTHLSSPHNVLHLPSDLCVCVYMCNLQWAQGLEEHCIGIGTGDGGALCLASLCAFAEAAKQPIILSRTKRRKKIMHDF